MAARGPRRVAVVVLATMVLAGGCAPLFEETVRGSGQVETLELELGEVTEVSVSSALDAEIVPGEEPSVTVNADDNVLEHIEILERGGRVELRQEPGIRLRNATVEITVTMPAVTEISASGASGVELAQGLDADDLVLSASGASDLRGTVEADRLDVSASGSSDVVVEGTTDELEVSASGSSDAELRQLTVGDARVEASGASEVTVTATGSLQASASGASDVRYAGDPSEVTIDASGGSSVEAGD